ncbi:Phosphatidylinositolglycan class N-domain-containing protein [Vararia minispora EC-137]|uniref:Phosphatidylinositolglycan class N-domain-containing protein n=1 Tax=Vararia minispora EC-137 TaxID=1314806 RepID=A0ACB8QVJ3_9AGAM|nr:Phosphatidylinositolglycan class N-domain-containing protein [Vararia minispora EC-137]
MTQPQHQVWPVVRLLTLGILFHLTYIGTVFDCYFTSPVVHGMRPYVFPIRPARRLVLIVGDGLRADFVFSANATSIVPGVPELVAPYLRNVIEERGAWGISHTRVPTESRPGHVALIGGMYEDVSAVTKGWKTNPVDFDSVFNRSSYTFSFGSPDILPMFERGAVPGRVKAWTYNEEDEDFTKDATELDIWVYHRLEELLRNATTDSVLNAQLHGEKVVFFLHLLGLDTTGHAYRPHSKEYMENIIVVDSIVRKTEKLLADFYGDGETSFVFTADHGMSRIGNHGDGDPDNTRTPLIAWGSGIRKPIHLQIPEPTDEYNATWPFQHLLRRDVEQADVAALMSALIGAAYPVNSVGVLPDIDPSEPGYLDLGAAELAQAGLVNAMAILEHYRVKHELKVQHALHYTPFPEIDHLDPSGLPASSQLRAIENDISSRQYDLARMKLIALIKTALRGLRYLETYDRTVIQVLVAFAYTGWIAFCAIALLAPSKLGSEQMLSVSHSPVMSAAFTTLLSVLWATFALQHSPITFYVYAAFPVYFWHEVFCTLWQSRRPTSLITARSAVKIGATVLSAAMALQGMVSAYGAREIWSIGFAIIGVVWPFTWRSEVRSTNKLLRACWTFWCLTTAVFPLLSVAPAEDLSMMFVSLRIFGIVSDIFCSMWGGIFLIILASIVTFWSVRSLQAKKGLPLLSQVLGWVIFFSALIPPLLPFDHASTDLRLLSYFLTFGPCFIILSICAEGLFYATYCITLWLWVRVEAAARAPGPKPNQSGWNPGGLRTEDVRIALFFLFFVQVGFFGTGNVASVSSFYLEPVYRLVPVFNPFLMAALLVFKMLSPYVMLSACFAVLNRRLNMPPFALFLVALALTDGMTVTFFFKVTDTGSWLEIGQSISHFCITSLLLVFSAGIAALGERLIGDAHGAKSKDNRYSSDAYMTANME